MRLTKMDRALFWETVMFRMLHVIIFEWQFIIAKLLKLTFFRKEKAH